VSVPALNPASLFVAPISGAGAVQSTIPYRSAATISTGSFVAALAITVFVLVVLVGGVAYARRRGWIIGSKIRMRGASGEGIEVRASRRLSMATTTHVVAYRGLEYLVVESARGCVTTIAPLNASRSGQSSAP
jgi:hypothetical protein